MAKKNKCKSRVVGNTGTSPSSSTLKALESHHAIQGKAISPETIKGTDDTGRFYNCYEELITTQTKYRDEFYRANALYWASGGYNGKDDDEAMIGDGGGQADGEEGLAFLDRYFVHHKSTIESRSNPLRFNHAVDLGAGVGRLTKHVLLKRYEEVRLVEADKGWSKRSRVYLGRKRAARGTFTNKRLDDLTVADVQNWGEPADLMWVQWTLQYLIDNDVVECLRTLSSGLRKGSGVFVVKENRPYGNQREDRFTMDLPGGENERYDITRNDDHHRLLFQRAGLKVDFMERGEETNTYVLVVSKEGRLLKQTMI